MENQGDILSRAKKFEMQALTEIYDRFSPGLYCYAARLLGDPDLAEECLSETFSRFLHALRLGKGPQAYLQAYLYRIAHNWITDQYRRQAQADLPLVDENLHDGPASLESQVATNLRQQQVREALMRLTPDQRQVIMLKYIEGWQNQEVAAVLEKPVGAVKSLQHRALAALRRMLLPEEERL